MMEDMSHLDMEVERLPGNPQHALKDKGVIDISCSRHMTGNISYLSVFEAINRGYVAFSGNPKGGKITGKGKIRTGRLDIDDVYFVKELKFNLFSGNPQNAIDDKGYWDSGCSRHMTGNISYLSDYEPYDGGYVSFGQGGCKITGKETIKT
nr:hypothetical protein [Tanacetum cinerariifolium]